ncbi:hypothetical protein ACX80E_15035 [Arthrobacter sp. TMN-49]
MTEQQTPIAPASAGPAGTTLSKAVAGPLTIRDLAALGSVALIFIASVIPLSVALAGSLNLWNAAGLFYLGIGVILPLTVGALFLVRRLSPEASLRIGSLSIDQFASVVASFATFFFFTATVTNFGVAYLLGLVGSLVLLTATVGAQWIPVLASDFTGRVDVPAHVVARDAVPAVQRPAAAKPVVTTPNGAGAQHQGAQGQQPPSGVAAGVAGTATGAQTTQQSAGWNAPQPAAVHTAAGQIFTPAKETGSAGVAGVAAHTAAHTVTDAAPAAAHTTAPAGTQAAAVPATPNTAGDLGAQTGVQVPVASGAVGLSADAPATTLNPQVAEPAAATPVKESIAATVNHNSSAAPVVSDPFWFAVDRPQNVIDEKTRQFVFKLTPGSWILALEDRGSSFLVQDGHGTTGILLDLVGIERASDSQ